MTIADAEGLSFRLRRQCAAMIGALDWHEQQAELDQIADAAIAEAARERWR